MATIVERANKEIAKLTKLGVRSEIVSDDGIVFEWSNSRQAWGMGYPVRQGTKIELDANEFYIPFRQAETAIKAINAMTSFNELPLYKKSFEAKHMGKFGSKKKPVKSKRRK